MQDSIFFTLGQDIIDFLENRDKQWKPFLIFFLMGSLRFTCTSASSFLSTIIILLLSFKWSIVYSFPRINRWVKLTPTFKTFFLVFISFLFVNSSLSLINTLNDPAQFYRRFHTFHINEAFIYPVDFEILIALKTGVCPRKRNVFHSVVFTFLKHISLAWTYSCHSIFSLCWSN